MAGGSDRPGFKPANIGLAKKLFSVFHRLLAEKLELSAKLNISLIV